MDLFSAQVLVHEHAIYIHESVQYHVDRLDWGERKAYVHRVDVDHYTYANRAVTLKPLDVFAEAPATGGRRVHGEVMVASLVTLFKKLKFVTDENVGWGPIDLPEIELQTTAYWLTAEGAAAGWRRDELDVALIGAGRALQAVAAVLLMVDPRDLGLVSQVRSPHHEAPTIYLYEAMPGGVGLSERLWARHDELVAGAAELDRGLRLRRAAARPAPGPRLEPDVDAQGARAAAPRGARARPASARRPRRTTASMTVERRRPASGGSRTCGRRSRRAGGPPPAATSCRRGRRSPGAEPGELAARLAAALGGEVVARRRRAGSSGARSPPVDDARSTASGSRACPGSRRRTRRSSASTRRPPGSRRPPGRSRSSSGSAGGRATRSASSSCCCPTTPTSRRCSPRSRAVIPPDAWLVTYNGRGFDWPLLVARYRLARRAAPAHAGHLDLLPFVRRVFRHRMADARLRTVEARAARRLAHRRRRGLGDPRPLPRRSCAAARSTPLAASSSTTSRTCVARPAARPPRARGTRTGRRARGAPRRPRRPRPRLRAASAATTRPSTASTTRSRRAAGPRPVRPDAGRARDRARAAEEERDAWWTPRSGRLRRSGAAVGWRGELANGRGGPLGPDRRRRPAAVGRRRPLDRRAPRRRAGAAAAAARALGGRGRGVADAPRPPAAASGCRLDRGREAPRARSRDPAGALAATRRPGDSLERLRATGPAAPAARGGPRCAAARG